MIWVLIWGGTAWAAYWLGIATALTALWGQLVSTSQMTRQDAALGAVCLAAGGVAVVAVGIVVKWSVG